MLRKYASTLIMLGLMYPGMATALGLGKLTLHSFLNEPLEAEVDLLETSGLDSGQIRIRLASREDFSRAGIEREYFLTSLKFEIELTEDGTGRLRITSTDLVREPFLDFLIEARWPNGRLLREYTVLLDPPVLYGPGSGVTASAVAPVVTPVTTASPDQSAEEKAADASRYGAGASSTPEPGAKYLVQRDDTLWSIARRARPPTATIQQTMLDIQRLNSEAFISNNINQLKAGYVLRLPTTAELSYIAPEELIAVIAEQDRDWQENLAAIDARRLDASEQADSSGVAGSDDEEGRLQIAGVEGDVSDSGLEGDLSARLENRDRVQRDNEDLQGRLNSMDEQVEMLKRLVTLKDDQIAALQNALADAGQTVDATIMDGEEGIIDAIVEPLPETPVVDEAPPPPPPPPPEPGLVDLLMDYLVYIVAGLVLVLGGLGWLFRDRINIQLPRRGGKLAQAGAGGDADDEFAGVELVADAGLIVDEFAGDATDDDGADEPLISFSAPDEEAYAAQFETGDALAEADIYIAYGRFPQAVDLLKTAIAMEPVNTEYRVKLMEACVEMVESGEFQQQYADLKVINDEAALQLARAMLDAVDGGEVWLDDLPEPSLTEEDVAAARAAAVPEPAASDGELTAEDAAAEPALEMLDLESMDDEGLELELDDSSLEDLAAADGGLDLELELDDGSLEDLSTDDDGLDLELGDGGLEDLAADGDELELESTDEGSGGLELMDLETESETEEDADEPGLEFASDLSGETELELEVTEETPATDESAGDTELEQFNMEDFQLEPAVEADATTGEEEESVELAEFSMDELSLDDEPAEELSLEPELEIAADDSQEAGSLDDLSAELSLEDTPDTEEPAEVEAEELEGFDLESLEEFGEDKPTAEPESESESEEGENGTSLVFAADGDEIATKLDLARAYMDMGDHEGARNIIDEVLQDGSDSQKQEAQSLLDSID